MDLLLAECLCRFLQTSCTCFLSLSKCSRFHADFHQLYHPSRRIQNLDQMLLFFQDQQSKALVVTEVRALLTAITSLSCWSRLRGPYFKSKALHSFYEAVNFRSRLLLLFRRMAFCVNDLSLLWEFNFRQEGCPYFATHSSLPYSPYTLHRSEIFKANDLVGSLHSLVLLFSDWLTLAFC